VSVKLELAAPSSYVLGSPPAELTGKVRTINRWTTTSQANIAIAVNDQKTVVRLSRGTDTESDRHYWQVGKVPDVLKGHDVITWGSNVYYNPRGVYRDGSRCLRKRN
jgi:hypothetical protein